jgi:hypothetical protein
MFTNSPSALISGSLSVQLNSIGNFVTKYLTIDSSKFESFTSTLAVDENEW